MRLLSSLNPEQKESINLLQIGTFLEYFDLMLYVHMAVLLNELFFPKTDPHTTSLLAAFALCSSLAFRPLGALIFGWIGDHIGRKSTIIMTTIIMATSCIIMANLPTYAQIGIAAAWIITICRIVQGMSSIGELIGAEIYLTESIPTPACYPAVALIGVAATLGPFVALGVAFFVLHSGLNWRLAFWIGAAIAIVGTVSRTRLRETPEFLEAKRKYIKSEVEKMNLEHDPIRGAKLNQTWKEPVNIKTLLSYFFISCGAPLFFYVTFVYYNPILKEKFGYSAEDIIIHNFYLAFISVICSIAVTYLTNYIHPLKINKVRGMFALVLMTALPFLTTDVTSALQLFVIQALIQIVILNEMPSTAIFMRNFPLYSRFTYASFLFALARALMYVVTSFGLIYLSHYLGSFGLWVLTLPTVCAYLYGIFHFEKLEIKIKPYALKKAA